jgi:hypothetical protein
MYFNQRILYQQNFMAPLPRPYTLSYHFILAQTKNLQAAHANILSEKHSMQRKRDLISWPAQLVNQDNKDHQLYGEVGVSIVLNPPDVSLIKEIVSVRPTGLCVTAFPFSLRRILAWLAAGSMRKVWACEASAESGCAAETKTSASWRCEKKWEGKGEEQ